MLNIQDRKEVGRVDPALQTEHLFPNKKSDASKGVQKAKVRLTELSARIHPHSRYRKSSWN